MRRLPLFSLLCACTGSIGDGHPSASPAIDEYIESLPYLPIDPAQVVPGAPSAAGRDGDYSCTTQNLQETRQFDRIVAYAANSDSLYPGALVSADSVLTGLFTQIVLSRAPETISVSLENLNGSKQARIQKPSLASYRDALSSILDSEINGSTPANIYSEIEQVHSQDQLDMALGVEASWGLGIASLRTSFDWQNQQVRSRYVVRYMQTYYTVDLDAPSYPSNVFGADVQLADVQAKMDQAHPPAYVSSVTYGRMVLFTFESEYSSEEMGAALDFAYSGGADVSGQTSVTYKDIISKSKITAYILGGDAGTAVQAIDSYDALIAFIKSGGNYSKQSPGAPIAYKLNYLKDNSPARMSMTTDYEVKDCTRVSQKIQVLLQSIGADKDSSIYGDVWADGAAPSTVNLFHKDSGQNVTIHAGGSFGPNIATGVIEVVPQPGQTLQLHAHLKNKELIIDDDLGMETSNNPFETGWRKDVTVVLTGAGRQVRVNFSIAPI